MISGISCNMFVCLWCLSDDDVACELTTGTVLCGSVSRALKNHKSAAAAGKTASLVWCWLCAVSDVVLDGCCL